MSDLISKLIDWIVWAFKSLVLTLWDAVADVLYLVLSLLLNIVSSLLTAVFAGLNSIMPSSITAAINSLPPEILNMLGLCGISEAMGIVVTALLIRLGLQLIPLVRLGS